MKYSEEQEKLKTDLDPVIEAYKKHIDLTLIRDNLRLTVDQRFQRALHEKCPCAALLAFSAISASLRPLR